MADAEDEIPSYLLSLSAQLRRRIKDIIQGEQPRIEKAIHENLCSVQMKAKYSRA
jgi:hypothetical protein